MRLINKTDKDEVFRRAEQSHLMTIAFLSAIKSSCDPKKAFEIAMKDLEDMYRKILFNYKGILVNIHLVLTVERIEGD